VCVPELHQGKQTNKNTNKKTNNNNKNISNNNNNNIDNNSKIEELQHTSFSTHPPTHPTHNHPHPTNHTHLHPPTNPSAYRSCGRWRSFLFYFDKKIKNTQRRLQALRQMDIADDFIFYFLFYVIKKINAAYWRCGSLPSKTMALIVFLFYFLIKNKKQSTPPTGAAADGHRRRQQPRCWRWHSNVAHDTWGRRRLSCARYEGIGVFCRVAAARGGGGG
jgi:hypothetical protein